MMAYLMVHIACWCLAIYRYNGVATLILTWLHFAFFVAYIVLTVSFTIYLSITSSDSFSNVLAA